MSMNILQAEDLVKGLPDQKLLQEAKAPSNPQIPQFLYLSEIQRRGDMRKRFQAEQQQPQGTVADQIIQGGIKSLGGGVPRGTMPGGGFPPTAPASASQTARPPAPPMRSQGMAQGGIVRLAGGGMPQTAVIDGKTYTWDTSDYPGLTRDQVLSLLVNGEYQGPREGASRRIGERIDDNYPWTKSFENWGENAGITGMGPEHSWPERDQAAFDTRKRLWEQYQSGGAEAIGPPSQFPASQGSNVPQADNQKSIDFLSGLDSLVPDFYARWKGANAITDDILSGLVERGYGKNIDEVRNKLDRAGITTYDEALALYNAGKYTPPSPGVGTSSSIGIAGQFFDAAEGFVGDVLGEEKTKEPPQKPLPSDKSVQGRKDAYSMLMDMYDTKSPDAPNFKNLIDEQKKDAFYGAMAQVAAGIGAGDMSKGIAAAANTAMQGRADARGLEQQSKMLDYYGQGKDIDRNIDILSKAGMIEAQRVRTEEYITRQEAMLERELAKQSSLEQRSIRTAAVGIYKARMPDQSMMDPQEYELLSRKTWIEALQMAMGQIPAISTDQQAANVGERPGLDTFKR